MINGLKRSGFREESSPIYVPAEYFKDDILDNKIIFEMAQIGGTKDCCCGTTGSGIYLVSSYL